jgi:hypothetical protein
MPLRNYRKRSPLVSEDATNPLFIVPLKKFPNLTNRIPLPGYFSFLLRNLRSNHLVE